MTSQSRQTRRNSKRPASNDPVQESSKTAQKRARITNLQSTLPFAPPPLSPPATQSPPVDNPTPCPAGRIDKAELVIEKTIRADERIIFQPDWSLVVDGESYRERPRSLRTTGSSRISFIYRHGLQLERKQPDGTFGKVFWLCKPCHDRRKVQAPLVAGATSQSIIYLQNKHSIVSASRLPEPPQSIVSHLIPAP